MSLIARSWLTADSLKKGNARERTSPCTMKLKVRINLYFACDGTQKSGCYCASVVDKSGG